MSIEGKWGFSLDGENYPLAYDTREAAIQAAKARGHVRFWVGQFRDPITDLAVDADDLLEKVLDHEDYCGDWADAAILSTQEQRDELTRGIRRVFRKWMDKYGLRPTFGIVEDAEEIVCDGSSS